MADPVTEAALGPGSRFSLILNQSRRMPCFLVPPVHQNRLLAAPTEPLGRKRPATEDPSDRCRYWRFNDRFNGTQ